MKNNFKKLLSVELTRYISVGLILVILDASTFFISNKFGAHYLLSQSLSLLVCSIFGTKLFSEKVFIKDKKMKSVRLNFILLNTFNIISFLGSYIFLYIFIDKLNFNIFNSKLFSIVIFTIFNYVTRKFFIFV